MDKNSSPANNRGLLALLAVTIGLVVGLFSFILARETGITLFVAFGTAGGAFIATSTLTLGIMAAMKLFE
ncbi:hypothetical protein [Streptosporangium saharense]|nr:hypothetical protein [Streptosporangium saharense]